MNDVTAIIWIIILNLIIIYNWIKLKKLNTLRDCEDNLLVGNIVKYKSKEKIVESDKIHQYSISYPIVKYTIDDKEYEHTISKKASTRKDINKNIGIKYNKKRPSEAFSIDELNTEISYAKISLLIFAPIEIITATLYIVMPSLFYM